MPAVVPDSESTVAGPGGGFLGWTCRAGTRPPGQPVTHPLGSQIDHRQPATGKVVPVSPHRWQGKQNSDVSSVAGNDNFVVTAGDGAGCERNSLLGSNKPANDPLRNTSSRQPLCKTGGQVSTVACRQTRHPAHHSPHDSRPSPPCRCRHQHDPSLARPHVARHHQHLRGDRSRDQEAGIGDVGSRANAEGVRGLVPEAGCDGVPAIAVASQICGAGCVDSKKNMAGIGFAPHIGLRHIPGLMWRTT